MTKGPERAANVAQVKVIRDMLMAMMSAADGKPTLEARRTGYDNWGLAFPLPAGARCEAILLGGVSADKITVLGSDATTALMYLHGGGYGIGSAKSHRHLVGQLCAASGLVGYNIDYRLAPETVFPGAVDDALSAYRGLLDTGISPDKIIIAGDSAGGGLTMACALAINGAGLPQPAGLFVMSPWVNLTQSGTSYEAKAEADFICNRQDLQDWADAYLAGSEATNPLASPVYGDLAGLAPLLIHVGSEEVLLSDSVKLAEVAGLAGVDVNLVVAPDMPHVWHYMYAQVDAGHVAIAEAGAWMEARLV
jgi:epsilon-lactone hydrolase